MTCIQKPIRTMVSAAVVLMTLGQSAQAGGFSLYTESSAAAIGNYAAGIAAEGADASIGWYNPAGLVLIRKPQVVLSGAGVFPVTELSGKSTFTTKTLLGPLPPYVQTFHDLSAAESAGVPSFHYAHPLGERATFGLSVVAPFGLSTEYGTNSPVRYAATRSDLKTFNVSPELGGFLTDHVSIGAGLDLQYAQVKFNSMIGSPALMQLLSGFGFPSISATTLDSLSYNQGHSFGVGFHAGVLGLFNDHHTRVGLNYQSRMRHTFEGYSELTGPLADPMLNVFAPTAANINAMFRSDTLRSNSIHLPDVWTLSAYQDVNPTLALLGSVVYTGWGVFDKIVLNNVAAGVSTPTGGVVQTLVNSTSIEDYRNAWRVAIGANYRVTEQWMMRVGGGYDQTPTITAERDVRLPDSDRWALSLGTHYQMQPNWGFDVGYTYLFGAEEAVINKTNLLGTTSIYNVNARANNHAQLVGLQIVWTDQGRGEVTK